MITAFLIESYPKLEEDDAENINRRLLEAIIHIGSTANSSIAPTLQNLKPVPFQITSATIRINIFWFLALVLSLVAALLALLVKQWLRRYMSWTHITRPRDSVTLRQLRYDALEQWQVFRIAGALPLIIQAAVILFLVGVVDLLWSLHTDVAVVITAVTVICLALVIGSAALPSIISTCPYRSPLAWTASRCVDWLRRSARKFRYLTSPSLQTVTWPYCC